MTTPRLSLALTPIVTPIFHKGEDLVEFICTNTIESLVRERMILAITSKVVSLAENRTVARSEIDKLALIKREADTYLGPMPHGAHLTIKNGLLLASAGIDESNSESGDFILYPENPFESAWSLWKSLREKWKIRELGILLTDSRTTPLRLGVTGFALAYCGFRGLHRRAGEKDLFGRELKMTSVNIADSLAASAVLLMGEAAESQPLVVVHLAGAAAVIEFSEQIPTDEMLVSPDEDLYRGLFGK